jgi:hypothetical protein
MGLYKNGKPDKAAIMAFQQKNGLKADGIIGPDTSGAILSAAKPGAAGSGRGGQGGPAAYKQTMPPMPNNTQQAATPVPVDPTKQSVNQRLSTGPSLIDQGRARLGIPAGGTAPAAKTPMTAAQVNKTVDQRVQQSADAAMKKSAASGAPVTGGAANADRRDFEESVDRMRRLSNMLKG